MYREAMVTAKENQHPTGSAIPFRPLVYWYVSLRCNLSCRHCWVDSSPKVDTRSDLTTQQCLDVVELLKEIQPSLVIISGGEPLVRADTPIILRALIAAGLDLSLETNATLLTPEVLSLLAEAARGGRTCWVSVSLDGGTRDAHEWMRGPGSFLKTVRAVRLLTEAGVSVGVQCLITKANLHTIPELYRLTARELGPVATLAFSVVYASGRAATRSEPLILTGDDWHRACLLMTEGLASFSGNVLVKAPPALIPPVYLSKLMGNPSVKFHTSCSFPALGILADGSLTICALTARRKDLCLGHVRRGSLVPVVRQSLAPLRDSHAMPALGGICGECVFSHSCRGGCRAAARTSFGSFLDAHPSCDALEREGKFPGVYRRSTRMRPGDSVDSDRHGREASG